MSEQRDGTVPVWFRSDPSSFGFDAAGPWAAAKANGGRRDDGLVLSLSVTGAKVVALAGDWHGNLAWAQKMIRLAKQNEAVVIVQLGDFGYWRPDPSTRKYLFRVERLLGELDMKLLWIDGNHEDHRRLAALSLADDGTRPFSDHVLHLPRGYRFTVTDETGGSYTWLAVGGAVSVDKQWRTPGRSWWPEEAINADEVAVAINGGPVDVLISHDAPSGVVVPDRRVGDWPADVLREAEQHRVLLRRIVDQVRPRELWHGHYHVSYDAALSLPSGAGPRQTSWVHGLDRDDSDPGLNLAFVAANGQRVTMGDGSVVT